MNCIHCDRSAHATCRFCGRAVCKDHLAVFPYIVGLYRGEDGIHKAIVVPDAVYCGVCKPREQPVPLPELK
jgi:hypothetical protein